MQTRPRSRGRSVVGNKGRFYAGKRDTRQNRGSESDDVNLMSIKGWRTSVDRLCSKMIVFTANFCYASLL